MTHTTTTPAISDEGTHSSDIKILDEMIVLAEKQTSKGEESTAIFEDVLRFLTSVRAAVAGLS